jgi:hypothetical protein
MRYSLENSTVGSELIDHIQHEELDYDPYEANQISTNIT